MSSLLTIDRFSGYTATQLNTFFNDFVTSFNGVLPSGIAVQNGNLFSDLELTEISSNGIAAGINTPYDILQAISYLGERLGSDGSFSEDDDLTNSSWSIGVIATDVSPSSPSYSSFVFEKLDDDDIELAKVFGGALVGSTYSITPFGVNQFENQYSNKASLLNILGTLDRKLGVYSPQQAISNTGSIVGGWNSLVLLRNQSVATRSFAVFGQLMNKFYSQSQVQPLSNSGGATWQQTSFVEETVDDGLSDKFTQTLITREKFETVGLNDWVVTRSALTTLTIETFEDSEGIDFGILGWYQEQKNNPTRITFENFSDGYELGTYPTRICSGGSGSGSDNEITENVTAQINGSTQIFSLTSDYVSGSLRVYWNGQRQIVGETITERNTNTFSTSFLPIVGEYLIADYVKTE